MAERTAHTALIEHHKLDCNRYVNGQCRVRRCMVRGGWSPKSIEADYATCEAHETVTALTAMLAALEGVVAALNGRVHSLPALKALAGAEAAIARAKDA